MSAGPVDVPKLAALVCEPQEADFLISRKDYDPTEYLHELDLQFKESNRSATIKSSSAVLIYHRNRCPHLILIQHNDTFKL